MLIDSHAHLTCATFDASIEEILNRALDSGIKGIININTHPTELTKAIELTKIHPWIFNAGATTPHDAEKEGEIYFDFFAEKALSKQLVAVGETGLDYHYFSSTQEIQKKIFIRYLELALACDLPVIIHCREAFEDFFQIIDQHYTKNGTHAPGVLHCFTGTCAEAEEIIKRGWYLSLSGIVTFKKSTELQKVAKFVPLDKLLIETDSPYLAPQNRRGKTNEPSFLQETAQFIADLREISVDELARAASKNAINLFNLKNFLTS